MAWQDEYDQVRSKEATISHRNAEGGELET